MCKYCVDEGTMTAEDLAAREAEDCVMVQPLTVEALEDLFSKMSQQGRPDPEASARRILDGVADSVLEAVREKIEPQHLESAQALHQFAESLAGRYMFHSKSSSIAYAMVVLALRVANVQIPSPAAGPTDHPVGMYP